MIIPAPIPSPVFFRRLRPAAVAPTDVFTTDFGEYTVSTPPGDWTASNVTLNIAAQTGTVSGQVLTLTGQGCGIWNAVPNAADVDLFTIAEKTGAGSNITSTWGPAARATNGSNFYVGGLRNQAAAGPDLLAVSKRVAGNHTLVDSISGLGLSPNVFYKVRYQVIGTNHRVKWWLTTDPEPGSWLLETTDSSFADPLGVGVGRTDSDAGLMRFQYLSVGINGASPVIL